MTTECLQGEGLGLSRFLEAVLDANLARKCPVNARGLQLLVVPAVISSLLIGRLSGTGRAWSLHT